MTALLTPVVSACTNAETRSQSRTNATLLAFARVAYREQNGSYPANLDGLTPDFVDKIPTDPLCNEILFTSDAKGYSLTIQDPVKIYDVAVTTPDRRKQRQC